MGNQNLSNEQFDPDHWAHGVDWYHGTGMPGLKTLDSTGEAIRFPNGNGVQPTYGGMNFVTNNPALAAKYARDSKDEGWGERPTVYRVTPTSPADMEVDDSYGGEEAAAMSQDDVRDYIHGGGWMAMIHHGPMRVAEEIDPDEAERRGHRQGWGA